MEDEGIGHGGATGFFDGDERLKTLSAAGDRLDRLSFVRFVGLALHDRSPTPTRSGCINHLEHAGASESLFARFDALLRARGWLAMGGQIIDATVIEARQPRLTQAEKITIKGDGTLVEWKPRARPDRPRRRLTIKSGRQRETPPSAGLKRQQEIGVPMFGYKNHIGTDREHGLLPRHTILDRDNTASDVWADTGYRSADNLALLEPEMVATDPSSPAPRPSNLAIRGVLTYP